MEALTSWRKYYKEGKEVFRRVTIEMTLSEDTTLRHIRKPMGVLGFDKTDVRNGETQIFHDNNNNNNNNNKVQTMIYKRRRLWSNM
jgi:hypothetical protein